MEEERNVIMTDIGNRKKAYIFLLAIIVMAALFLRVYKLGDESLRSDEISQVQLTAPKLSYSAVWHWSSDQVQPPLDYLILHTVQKFKTNDFMVRLPAAVFGAFSVLMLFILVKLMLGIEEALISALLLTVSIFHIQFSQEVRIYSISVFINILAQWIFYKLLIRGNFKEWIAYFIIMLLSFYTHVFFPMIMGVQIIVVLFLFCSKKWILEYPGKITMVKIFAIISFFALIFWIFLPEYRLLTSKLAAYGFTAHADKLPLNEQLIIALKTFTFLPLKIAYIKNFSHPVPVIFLFLSVIGIISMMKKKYALQLSVICAFFILLSLLIVAIMHFRGRYIRPRHLIFSLPFYLITVSRGIVYFSELISRLLYSGGKPIIRKIMLIGIPAGIVLSHVGPLAENYRVRLKEDWRTLTEYVDKNISYEDELIFIAPWTVNNYYQYGRDKENTIGSLYYYGRNIGRNMGSKFLRKRWWITAHGASVTGLKEGEDLKLVKEFTGGVFLWTVNGNLRFDIVQFLDRFPEQMKRINKDMNEGTTCYINNIDQLQEEYDDIESRMTKIANGIYDKKNIQIKNLKKFEGVFSSGKTRFFDYYEGGVIDYTAEVLTEYEKRQNVVNEIVWNFEDDTSEGWEVSSALISKGITNGVWSLESTGEVPVMKSPGLSVPYKKIKEIVFRIKHDAKIKKNMAALFWITENDSDWGTKRKNLSFEIVCDGEYRDYTIDLLNCARWRYRRSEDDIITGFRLDPVKGNADIEMDSIKIRFVKPDYIVKSIIYDEWLKRDTLR